MDRLGGPSAVSDRHAGDAEPQHVTPGVYAVDHYATLFRLGPLPSRVERFESVPFGLL